MNDLSGAITSDTQPDSVVGVGDGAGEAVADDRGVEDSSGAVNCSTAADGLSAGSLTVSRSRNSRTTAGLIMPLSLKSPTRGDGWGDVSIYGTLLACLTGLFPSRLSTGGALPATAFGTAMDPEDASLDVDDEVAGESDRVDCLSSMSTAKSKLDDMLEFADGECAGRGGDLTMFARARFATDTWRTMVAGVTVIVDKLESRFSLSREKSTFSSFGSGCASTEVAGEVVAPGVLGGNNGLAAGLEDDDFDPGV